MKARDADPARSLGVCESLGAADHGVLVQRDTYFGVPSGRLKLREEEGARPHLISYRRPDLAEQRESRYRIIVIEQADELRAALSETLGVKVVVAKRRRLFIWQDVRIHLDRVDGLGDFIEFEAVAPADSDLSCEEDRVRTLREAFEITEKDLIGGSYCDLMLAEADAR